MNHDTPSSVPNPMKVYELAKELGIDSISLVEKLRSLNFPVKNHMSELDASQAGAARVALNPATQVSDSEKKPKTAVRKRATAAAGTATATTKTSAAAASGTTTTVRRTAAKKTAVTESPSSQQASGSQAVNPVGTSATTRAGTIIRRKSSTSGVHGGADEQGLSHELEGSELQASDAAATHEFADEEQITPAEPAPKRLTTFSYPPKTVVSDSAKEHVVDLTVELKSDTSATPQQATTSTSEAKASTESSIGAGPSATGQAKSASPTQAMPSTHHEVKPSILMKANPAATAPGQISPNHPLAAPRTPVAPIIRPTAPLRKLLKVVETAPILRPSGGIAGARKPGVLTTMGAKFGNKGTTAAPTPAAGVRSLKDFNTQARAGFKVSQAQEAAAEEELRKKRAREGEIRPEDVKFADYRKKELVFLPKKKRIPLGKSLKRTSITQAAAHKRVVEMMDRILVSELAAQMGVKASEVIKKLMMMGQMANINQSIDMDTATLVATEFGFEVKNISFKEEGVIQSEAVDEDSAMQPRPPIVTIMGHVDHGKTSLLDALRETNVAGGEAGGITQHIGAYTVQKDGKTITFIDTPGHEAFAVMRARGANVTDIVILVVAADDGVMPQTREALSHAKAAGVPIIVAVNKIDKPGANPEKIKQTLADLDLLAEDWGGQTMFVPVSALKRTNLDKLLEAILLQAEVLDLKANADAAANGAILEARLDKGRGPVASVLIQRGSLRAGDAIVAGNFYGRVRAMMNHLGENVKEATPAMAVEILGLNGVPAAGEEFYAVENESAAEKVVTHRIDKARADALASQKKITLENLFSKVQSGDTKELGVILKGDVSGSVEAVKDSLLKLSTDKVKIKVLFAAPGGVTESDVLLASASKAVIIGFNVRPEIKARELAESNHIDIKCYTIIYELIDDIKKAMGGLLEKKKVEVYLGRAEVRQVFSVPKIGTVAGCGVVDGKIVRSANVRLLRESRIIFDGKLASLKRFKDDAKEVAQGFECGMGIENYNDLKLGDIIEAYQIEMVAQEL